MDTQHRKVVVIGAGSVGTTYIYALLPTGLANEIVLIDLDRKKVEGEIMDLSHGLSFIPPVSIKAGDYSDCSDAWMIVVTAGARQKAGQSREDLIQSNASVVKSICTEIKKSRTDAILVMVTNPVDTLTQLALSLLGWPRNHVIGSGTVLDSSRLRYMLSSHCNIDARNVHAYVAGEHGDSEVVLWSMAHIAGVPLLRYCQVCNACDSPAYHLEIAQRVKDSAYHIINYKGSTFFGIGLSLVRISSAILRNERSVLTVSTMLNGEYGIHDLCLSVPCVLGRGGAERVIDAQLPPDEHQALQNSAKKLRETYESMHVLT